MEATSQTKQSRKPTRVRRQEIIDAGIRILTSEGARQFTAEHLAAEVGITGGTIFRHFGSMDEILDAIVDRIEAVIFADFPPRDDDPLEALRQFFTARVLVISRRPEISKLLLTNMLIPNAHAGHRRERLQEFIRRSRQFVIGCLEEAGRRQMLARDVTPEEGLILVLGSIHAIGHLGIRTGGSKGASGVANRTWKLLERTLRGKP